MMGFDPADSFGADVADRYDDRPRGDEAPASLFLKEIAEDGRALEFAIGTGRIALPLAALGVPVSGIELSPDMVAKLRAKPGGEAIPIHMGDMSEVEAEGEFDLVYLVYNTIFNLLSQDEQVDCFVNAASHLSEGGAFVVEAAVPSAWTREHEYARPEAIGRDHVTLDVCRYDPVTQILEENHVRIGAEGIRFAPIVCRLASPAELDLMARLAGLRLEDRWGGWNREPFTARSELHVSVYRKPAA